MVQQNNVVILLILLLLRQNAGEGRSFGRVELLHAPVAYAAKRCTGLKLTQQHTRLVIHPAVHSNRVNHGSLPTELQVGQVHLKMEILAGAGGMQNPVHIQNRSTPRNDTSSIILNFTLFVKHFLTNILTFLKNKVE